MEWFSNLKIRRKLVYSFVLVAVIAGVVGGIGIYKLNTVSSAYASLYDNYGNAQGNLGIIAEEFQRIRAMLRDMILENKIENIKSFENLVQQSQIIRNRNMNEYNYTIILAEDRANFDNLDSKLKMYDKIIDQLIVMANGNSDESALAFLRSNTALAVEISELIDKMIKFNIDKGNEWSGNLRVEVKKTEILLIVLVLLGGILAIWLGSIIAKLISKPIDIVVERAKQLQGLCISNLGLGMENLAKGNIDYKVVTGTPFLDVNTKDEIGMLAESVNSIIRNTQKSVRLFEDTQKIIKNLLADIKVLIESTHEGKLNKRGDGDKYDGVFKELITGFNETLISVATPLDETGKVLTRIGNGDFTAKMTGEYKGDFLELKNNVNHLTESLGHLINKVNESVQATASASIQISSSTEEMAAGAQEQTMQTTEIAGAVEEMTKTILENSKNTSLAADTAKKAGTIAKEGGVVMEKTVTGMVEISQVVEEIAVTIEKLGISSQEIGEIIQVIDEIADQTNLLALNAAIEAARAGEQGRGFAVVADEVRKLAERTTRATKEIAEKIKSIQNDTQTAVDSMKKGTDKVDDGKSLVGKAGNELKKIIVESEKVADLINQIAAASEQQSSTSEEISKSIEHISNVTQETATAITQVARSSEDLGKLTHNLQEIMDRFKI